MAFLVDTHAHLDDEQFAADLPAVLDRARAAGVAPIITIATTAASSAACVALAARHPNLFATAGIHPNNLEEVAPPLTPNPSPPQGGEGGKNAPSPPIPLPPSGGEGGKNAPSPPTPLPPSGGEGSRLLPWGGEGLGVRGAWDEVVALMEQPRVVGVGETGLDRHWGKPFALQEEYFARHLELGRTCNRAVVIHCREAEADVLRMLREAFDRHGPIRGVMHSFTGDAALAEACRAMGLYLSFAGMLTYKNAGALRETAARQPLDRVLVETDSPYLSPVPLRGKRNEPAHVVHTAACLAGLLGIDMDQLAEATTRNACALFGLPA